MRRLYCDMLVVIVHAALEPCLLAFVEQLSRKYINGIPWLYTRSERQTVHIARKILTLILFHKSEPCQALYNQNAFLYPYQNALFTSRILGLLQNRPDHLIPHLGGLGEPRLKVLLDALKLLPVRIEVAETDSLTPIACSKRELEIICAERIIVDGGVDCFLQERRVAEE